MIPQHSFICLYVAQIYDAEEHERLVRATLGWFPFATACCGAESVWAA